MTHHTRPRPPDPYASKNPFPGRKYKAKSWPTLQEARPRLPEPLLPDQPVWVEMYWRSWELVWANLRRPKPGSGFIANFLKAGPDEQLNLWDSAFAVHFGLYGRRAFDFVGALDNFYAKQDGDGFICREISLEHGHNLYHAFDPNSTGPNLLAWSEWRTYRSSGDEGRLAEVFWPLLGYHRWLKANHTWRNGLYWTTGLASAMENQDRILEGRQHHQHAIWVDATMQAALDCYILAQMALQLDEAEAAEALNDEHFHLLQEINARLWDEQAGFYKDVDGRGGFSPVLTVGAYWALLDREIVPPKRMEAFLSPLRDPAAFKRPHLVPSLPANSPGYEGEGGDFWRGGVWPAADFMLVKGLRQIGQERLAHAIALNHLANLAAVYERTDTLWQYYAPESAAPGPDALANSAVSAGLSAIAMLLEDVIGLQVDWPRRQVVWDRRLESGGPYGVRGYPLGPDGLLDLSGDAERVTIETTVPFNLTIQTAEGRLQTSVPAGQTEVAL